MEKWENRKIVLLNVVLLRSVPGFEPLSRQGGMNP